MPDCCPFTHNSSLIQGIEEFLYYFLEDRTDDPEDILIWKEEIVKLITDYDDINCIDDAGNSLLMMVIYHHVGPLTLSLVTELVEEYGAEVNYQNFHYNPTLDAYQSGCTALHVAASHGYAEIVKYLLTQGADPTLKEDNETPYDMAVAEGHRGCCNALEI
jgi:ankyrin repeat protein